DQNRRLPAIGLQNEIGDFTPRSLPERKTAIDEGDGTRSAMFGKIFAGQNHARRQGAAKPYAGQEPQDEQLERIACDGGEPSQKAKADDAGDGDALVPE